MAKMRVEGSFVALITPFNADGTVDFGAFRSLLDWQACNGTSAVLIMGSTGEVSMLSPEERRAIVEGTIRFRDGRMKFFYGCTGNNTATTIEYLRHAQANGADGAILAAPAYICAAEADIEAFFAEVADAVDLPLGIYNNPPRVKTDLHWEALLRLLRHPNYVVLKESTARVGQVAQVLAGKPEASVMCCDSPNLGLVVPTMALGGQGGEDAVEHSHPAPADEAVVERLVRPVGRRCVSPLQAVADDIDDPAQHAPVIHPWDASRAWEMRRQTLHLGSREQKRWLRHRDTSAKPRITPRRVAPSD